MVDFAFNPLSPLTPEKLISEGKRRIQDPNQPVYNPDNVDKPIRPFERNPADWLSKTRGRIT